MIDAAPGLVVIDEAYQPFADGTWMPRVLDLPNVVVMRTVSKIGLAGLRFGYLAGSPDWIAELNKVRPPYNLDVLTQAALLAVLRHKPVLDEQAARLRADRGPLAAALAPARHAGFPSAGNFVRPLFRQDGWQRRASRPENAQNIGAQLLRRPPAAGGLCASRWAPRRKRRPAGRAARNT